MLYRRPVVNVLLAVVEQDAPRAAAQLRRHPLAAEVVDDARPDREVRGARRRGAAARGAAGGGARSAAAPAPAGALPAVPTTRKKMAPLAPLEMGWKSFAKFFGQDLRSRIARCSVLFQRVLKLQTGQIFRINARLVKGGGAEALGRFSGRAPGSASRPQFCSALARACAHRHSAAPRT